MVRTVTSNSNLDRSWRGLNLTAQPPGTTIPSPTLTSGVSFMSSFVNYPDYTKRDWKRLIREKKDATTVLSGRKYQTTQRGYMYAYFYGTRLSDNFFAVRSIDGYVPLSGVPLSPTISSSDLNIARGKFLAKCRQIQRPFMVGVALGEIRETIHMLRHPLQSLAKAQWAFSKKVEKLSQGRKIFQSVSEMKQASQAERRRKVGALSNLWLEHSYGWKPLYNDIDSGCEALSRLSYMPPTVKVTSKHAGKSLVDFGLNTSINGFPITGNDTNLYSWLVKHRGAIKVGPESPMASFGFDPRSLGFLDLIPTVWELIPYSFLIDYFFDVGTMLDALTFLNSDIAWACETQVRSGLRWSNRKIGMNVSNSTYPGIQTVLVEPYQSSVVDFERAPYTGAYVPTLKFKVPLSPMRWVNIAALSAQFYSSGRGGTKRTRI